MGMAGDDGPYALHGSEGKIMNAKLLIAGIPRCGTTWLYRCIAGLPQKPGTPKGKAYQDIGILKVHSLAPPDSFGDPQAEEVKRFCEEGGKCIFVFGNPVLAVLSTRQRRWDHVHAANCGYFEDLGNADIFAEDMQPFKLYNVKKAVWHTHALSLDAQVLIVENRDTTYDNSPFFDLRDEQKAQIMALARPLGLSAKKHKRT